MQREEIERHDVSSVRQCHCEQKTWVQGIYSERRAEIRLRLRRVLRKEVLKYSVSLLGISVDAVE